LCYTIFLLLNIGTIVKARQHTHTMERKLRCAIVDDDQEAHNTIIELLKDSPLGEVTHSFYKPSDLLRDLDSIDIDVVFLDIMFPNDTMQGLDAAPLISAENKAVIFISGRNEFIVEACKYAGAIDVLPKPTNREKLLSALLKVQKIIAGSLEGGHKEHGLFFVAERKEQVSLLLSDIYFVQTAAGDRRNKEILMKSGEKLTLMDCTFGNLLQLSPKLAQINISQLISYDIVEAVLHDTIYLKPHAIAQMPKILTLSKTHRQKFKVNFT